MACEESISETAMPAPWRLACRRTNQLPMPASGASITRLGTLSGPSCQGAVRRACVAIGPLCGGLGRSRNIRAPPLFRSSQQAARVYLAIRCAPSLHVHLVDETQPCECQEIVHLVDLLGEGRHQAR